ncbi:hypothetical protein [Haloechinothrix sp. LS1_15]|uniref:hypothetical protein n=1 Tax=Haloechinothrix sp. LS1_15 TaxID=2652248 RepID=UPI002947FE38|nr:hypothetical protein [Haloechinothrix sp. LS1_15]MDV6012943.1 hypothetical protein [Haloechinothrix sp. LS1_15]
MTSGFFADADRIAARAGEFTEHAERARAIAAALDEVLCRTGNAWGSDATGAAFAARHAPDADRVRDRVAALPAHLRDAGDRLAEVAARYREAEGEAADRIVGIARDPER